MDGCVHLGDVVGSCYAVMHRTSSFFWESAAIDGFSGVRPYLTPVSSALAALVKLHGDLLRGSSDYTGDIVRLGVSLMELGGVLMHYMEEAALGGKSPEQIREMGIRFHRFGSCLSSTPQMPVYPDGLREIALSHSALLSSWGSRIKPLLTISADYALGNGECAAVFNSRMLWGGN